MATAAPETASIVLWTMMRAAALLVLATEALFLWMRRREPAVAHTRGQAFARLFWAATPAILLAGLALWCAAALAQPDAAAQIAQLSSR
jgi:heme/copper-type cytochrome/quinol oxidase subunit 2